MKLRWSWLLLLLCTGLVWAGAQERKLARWLEQYPQADANGDGRLTDDEAQAYRQKLQGRATADRSETSQGTSRQFKVDPGWDHDRFPDHAVCYRSPTEIRTIYAKTLGDNKSAVTSYPKPASGALRIVGTGHSFMGPGYKTFPIICRAAGFEQPLLTHTGGGITGSARYKWEQENGIFEFEGNPRPKLLASIANAEWDAMMWGPFFHDRPAYYACWIDFCLKYHPHMKFYLSDAWPQLDQLDEMPTSEDALNAETFVRLGKERNAQTAELIGALNKKYPGKVFVIPTSDAMVLAAQHYYRDELPGLEGIHRAVSQKERSLWRDRLGHLGPGFDRLEGYVFYATLYARSPEFIEGDIPFGGSSDFPSRELDRLFRKIAWQAVVHNPLSCVTDRNHDGRGDNHRADPEPRDIAHAEDPIYRDPAVSEETRVKDLLGRLTLEEKAGFMAGKDMWFLKGVERLGIPSVQVTDGGHGVTVILDEAGRYTGCATCFPTAVSQAASWDTELVYEIGSAIAREARALGSAFLLAPMVNIHRTPLNGRNYETYSEDPFLAAALASAFVRGVQSEHIGAVIKAMTVNNQQTNQQGLNVEVSERALHEIYLPAFRIPVLEAKPWGVMTAYNGLNGHRTCASRYLITEILKGRWRYDGFVVSDWRSVQGGDSIAAGLDIEMPGPGRFLATKDVLKAVANGMLTEEELDSRVGRYLRALVKSKLLDKDRPPLAAEANTPRHRVLARRAAEASIVLLQNRRQVLPLDRSRLRTLAIIGPNAEEARLGGGGSASVTACHTISPLKGLQDHCGSSVAIQFVEGTTMKGNLPIVGSQYVSTTDRGKTVPGLKGEYFANGDLAGTASLVRVDEQVDFSWGWAAPCEQVGKGLYSVRWTGRIRAPATGTYRIGVTCHEGDFRLLVNEKTAIDRWGNPQDQAFEADFSRTSESIELHLEEGATCDVRLEFRKRGNRNAIRLEWQVPGQCDPVEEAVRLAAQSDAAIVFAGLSNLFEGGMNDRTTLALPEGQDRLIASVARANANTIVVLVNGTPVAMPWLDEVAAIVEAYYPGQEGGGAIAWVLFGEVNPSGKLPETFPKRLEDNPSHGFFPGEKGRVAYGEGIYVGYRHYDTKGIEPLFPFGHGLSYTQFAYSDLTITQEKEGDIRVAVAVTNTGKTAGAETVQLYVRDVEASVDRPTKELKAFAKVHLFPGQTKRTELVLARDAFAFFCPVRRDWVVEPGVFELLIGSSSRDIRLTGRIAINAPFSLHRPPAERVSAGRTVRITRR